MEWIKRLNNSIAYIEEHLTEDINYEKLAEVACCSSYHYQRMFTYMADVTLSEYIRRRRMSLAATDLQGSEAKIIDIALKYGYSSPTAFNRAFQSVHGIAPSLVREQGTYVKSFPPISFTITVKGVEELNYRIETKEAFRIVGVSHELYRDMEKNFEVVPQMWTKATTDGTMPKLSALIGSEPLGILGVSLCCGDDWRYFIAVASPDASDETLEEYTVPAFTWAIFPGEGECPEAIQTLKQKIVTEWLPTSGYEYANGPDIEVYISPDPKNSKFEVWIPVTKK